MWLCPPPPLLLFLISFTNVNKTTKYKLSVSCFSQATDALYSHWCRREPWPRPLNSCFSPPANQSSVDYFVNCGLLVPGASDDELVIGGDVAAENRRRLLGLKRRGEEDMLAPVSESRGRESMTPFSIFAFADSLTQNSGSHGLPGICWIHKVSAMHSGGYLCPCSQTIYLQNETNTHTHTHNHQHKVSEEERYGEAWEETLLLKNK